MSPPTAGQPSGRPTHAPGTPAPHGGEQRARDEQSDERDPRPPDPGGRTMSATRPLRVAVVGAGPAGLYAADYLTFDGDGSVRVDLIERLPVPFGLLRYGVAPDHLNIKAAGLTLMEVLERADVDLYANVAVGTDVT